MYCSWVYATRHSPAGKRFILDTVRFLGILAQTCAFLVAVCHKSSST